MAKTDEPTVGQLKAQIERAHAALAASQDVASEIRREADGYLSQIKALNEFASACRREAEGAQKETLLVREQFADLKQRLHEAEVSKARLEGYLDRVAQDDRARDGHEVILSEGNDVDAKPRRSDQGYRAGYVGGYALSGESPVSERNRRVHWTSY